MSVGLTVLGRPAGLVALPLLAGAMVDLRMRNIPIHAM